MKNFRHDSKEYGRHSNILPPVFG